MNKKISWCLKQNKGIKIITPNNNLSLSYIKEADETFYNMLKTTGKWKLILGYYSCYNALYSILIKTGIQSKIHECSIILMNLFNFDKKEIQFMKKLKENRIRVQYYLENLNLKEENKIKEFIIKCKLILNELEKQDIKIIQNKIKKFL